MTHAKKGSRIRDRRLPALGRAHGSEWRSVAKKRFHELLVKHCLGTATPEEEKKLDRYQELRRSIDGLNIEETHEQKRRNWELEQLMKTMRAVSFATPNTTIGHDKK